LRHLYVENTQKQYKTLTNHFCGCFRPTWDRGSIDRKEESITAIDDEAAAILRPGYTKCSSLNSGPIQ
jgi:hypothetical protein